MKNYGIVIDVMKCNGCYSCFLACKDEHCGEEFPGYSAAQPMTGQYWMNLVEVERGTYPKVKLNHIPVTCAQCKNPACMKAAEDGAVYKREDGIVMIDPVKAAGQKQIVNSCPYRVIFWNQEKNVAQKCTMCAHLLDEGYKTPRCVELCPTGRMQMAVPALIRNADLRCTRSVAPSSNPASITAVILMPVYTSPDVPAFTTSCRFMPKPRATTEACSRNFASFLLST